MLLRRIYALIVIEHGTRRVHLAGITVYPDGTRTTPLIWNHQHLLHALREFEQFYNCHWPHQGIANARPLRALPSPIPLTDVDARLRVRRRDRLGGILHEYRHAA